MADDNETKVILDLDNEDFVAKMRESLGLMDVFGNADQLVGLTDKLVEIGVILGPLVALGLAIKTAFDMTKEAEHIDQVNRSFEMLAQSAGLASDALKAQLSQAAGGLVGETELLQSANKAIIEMGGNAAHLPEIMEIARKATVVFGGDLTSNFDNISRALANGNERMLRQYGIIVDTTKAHDDYAKSLGVGVEFLSAAGQKQAIFNAAMDAAKDKFSSIDTSTMKTTQSSQSLWAAVKDLWEAYTVGISKALQLSEGFSNAINKIATYVKFWADDVKKQFGIEQESSEKKQENLKKEIALHEEVNKSKTGSGLDAINHQKLLQAETKFQGDLLKLKEAAEKDQEKVETDFENFKKLRQAEILSIEQTAKQKEHDLEINAHAKGLITDQQMAQARVNIEKKKEEDIKAVRVKAEQDQLTALKNLEAQNTHTAVGFEAAWKKAGVQASMDLKDFSKLGETSFKAVDTHASAAFKALGNGSKDAAQAMKGFMFGALGDMATSQGEYFLAAGLGSLAGGSPGGAIQIAEGGALIALGAALSSMGSSSGSSAPSASGGGASASAASPTTQAAAAPTPAATQSKSLTVAFHGDYFDTDQTRTRFMDMIRQSGDFTDFNLLKVGQSS